LKEGKAAGVDEISANVEESRRETTRRSL
jgi:hypothetical protein